MKTMADKFQNKYRITSALTQVAPTLEITAMPAEAFFVQKAAYN